MKNFLSAASCFTLVTSFFYSSSILAVDMMEQEDNHPISFAQVVVTGLDATLIDAAVGQLNAPASEDVDFYRFYAREGDVISLDIDHGIGGDKDVDTKMALFGDGPDYVLLRENDDSSPLDEGSVSSNPWRFPDLSFDSRIDDFMVPVTGTYYVAVTHFGSAYRNFADGGIVVDGRSVTPKTGDYDLIVTGASEEGPQEMIVSIEVKPGSKERAPLNINSKGQFPVAILSSEDFDAMDVDRDSLTFGHNGDEDSLAKCLKHGKDVNKDGRKDLVCHFHTSAGQFMNHDLEGVLRGTMKDGMPIVGRGMLKVISNKSAD